MVDMTSFSCNCKLCSLTQPREANQVKIQDIVASARRRKNEGPEQDQQLGPVVADAEEDNEIFLATAHGTLLFVRHHCTNGSNCLIVSNLKKFNETGTVPSIESLLRPPFQNCGTQVPEDNPITVITSYEKLKAAEVLAAEMAKEAAM